MLKIGFYLLSLTLLFSLLFINEVDIPICFEKECEFIGYEELMKKNIYPIFYLFLIFLGLLFYPWFKYLFKNNGSLPENVDKIENVNWENLTFLATYIIPLLSFNFGEGRNRLIFFLILLIMGIMFTKTNMYYTNPILAILGYHIYKLSTKNKEDIIVISRDVLYNKDKIKLVPLSDNVYIAKKIHQ
ncbi:anti-phage protein KwaA [Capnocytophaga cynodegmi]|uniref:anti-phage protein KwaA n=1 Tax=Capnocytophaga cynodegmi TaxID=28189 RepID=UPI0038582C2A